METKIQTNNWRAIGYEDQYGDFPIMRRINTGTTAIIEPSCEGGNHLYRVKLRWHGETYQYTFAGMPVL